MILLQTVYEQINLFITANTPFTPSTTRTKTDAFVKSQVQATVEKSAVKKEAAIIEGTAQKEQLKKTKVAAEEVVSHASSSSPSQAPTEPAAKPQVRTLVISTSLREGSRSRKLALKIQEKIKDLQLPCDFLDMKDYPNLPLCDGKSCYANQAVNELTNAIAKASNIILAFPVYNYDCNSAAKNLIDLTGTAWNDKVVGFIATAGSARSFMSPLNLGNSLMLNSNCMIVPKYVFADPQDFPEKTDVLSAEMDKRIATLARTSTKMAACWNEAQTK